MTQKEGPMVYSTSEGTLDNRCNSISINNEYEGWNTEHYFHWTAVHAHDWPWKTKQNLICINMQARTINNFRV
jgi:hypothetical protein